MLFDNDIRNAIAANQLSIEPLIKENIGPSSVDVTLHDEFLIPNYDTVYEAESIGDFQ